MYMYESYWKRWISSQLCDRLPEGINKRTTHKTRPKTHHDYLLRLRGRWYIGRLTLSLGEGVFFKPPEVWTPGGFLTNVRSFLGQISKCSRFGKSHEILAGKRRCFSILQVSGENIWTWKGFCWRPRGRIHGICYCHSKIHSLKLT